MDPLRKTHHKGGRLRGKSARSRGLRHREAAPGLSENAHGNANYQLLICPLKLPTNHPSFEKIEKTLSKKSEIFKWVLSKISEAGGVGGTPAPPTTTTPGVLCFIFRDRGPAGQPGGE